MRTCTSLIHWVPGALLICQLAVFGPQASAGTLTPASLPGVIVVTAEQAQTLKRQGVPLYDVRVAHEYVEEHIQGAISLPYKEKSAKHLNYDARVDSFDLTRLPKDRSLPIIFYCNAGECWKSYKASKAAIAAGYTRVHWLRGGIPEWKQKGLPVE